MLSKKIAIDNNLSSKGRNGYGVLIAFMALSLISLPALSNPVCKEEDVLVTSRIISKRSLTGQLKMDFATCALPIAKKQSEEFCSKLSQRIDRSKLMRTSDEVDSYLESLGIGQVDISQAEECSFSLKKIKLIQGMIDGAKQEQILEWINDVKRVGEILVENESYQLTEKEIVSARSLIKIDYPNIDGAKSLAMTVLFKKGISFK